MNESRGRCVLVADDSPDIRALLRIQVEADVPGAMVITAPDGPAALEAWRNHNPDVVVLDHHMPGMTGLDVAADILTEDPSQVVVICSAYLTGPDLRRAKALGVFMCLSKTESGMLPAVIRLAFPDARRTGT